MSTVQLSGQMNLQHIADMLEQVPAPETTYRQLAELQKRSQDVGNNLISLGDKLGVSHSSPPGIPPPGEQLTEEMKNSLHTVQQKAAPLSMDIAKFVDTTIKDADDLRKTDEHKLKFWSVVCNVLFVVGWLFGLVGKISGVTIESDAG
jgi:hypothetical protein